MGTVSRLRRGEFRIDGGRIIMSKDMERLHIQMDVKSKRHGIKANKFCSTRIALMKASFNPAMQPTYSSLPGHPASPS